MSKVLAAMALLIALIALGVSVIVTGTPLFIGGFCAGICWLLLVLGTSKETSDALASDKQDTLHHRVMNDIKKQDSE